MEDFVVVVREFAFDDGDTHRDDLQPANRSRYERILDICRPSRVEVAEPSEQNYEEFIEVWTDCR